MTEHQQGAGGNGDRPDRMRRRASWWGSARPAGGIKALQEFFQGMPPDSGAAFVVVLHLSPEHESHLAEVLQVVTRMPVTARHRDDAARARTTSTSSRRIPASYAGRTLLTVSDSLRRRSAVRPSTSSSERSPTRMAPGPYPSCCRAPGPTGRMASSGSRNTAGSSWRRTRRRASTTTCRAMQSRRGSCIMCCRVAEMPAGCWPCVGGSASPRGRRRSRRRSAVDRCRRS